MAIPVTVVGAGPAGLAVAARLGARGVPVAVLERGDRVRGSWASLRPPPAAHPPDPVAAARTPHTAARGALGGA